MKNVPQEIQWINQWSYSFGPNDLKRPTHYTYEPDGALSLSEARQKAGAELLVGLYVTHQDRYILGDIDKVANPQDPFEDLPIGIVDILKNKGTYSEISPSGRGIRFLLKLPHSDDKSSVNGSIFFLQEYKGTDRRKEIQINFGPPWMTITGNVTPYSSNVVALTSIDELSELFHMPLKEEVERQKAKRDFTKLPSMNEVVSAVMSIPHDQNPRVKRAYEQTFLSPYSHYDFWIKILMGIHNIATLLSDPMGGLNLAIEWSSRDTISFKGEEDVTKHWRSFEDIPIKDAVTYKTIFKMAYSNVLRWPVAKKQSKAEIERGDPKKPITSEYANFEALLDFYDIHFYRDEIDHNRIFLTGDSDIIEQHFMMYKVSVIFGKYYGPYDYQTLTPVFHMFCQTMGFTGVSHNIVTGFIKNVLATTRRTINFIRIYFDTPYEELPDEYKKEDGNLRRSTFEEVFRCLKLDLQTVTEEDEKGNYDDGSREKRLYFEYYKRWLMGFIRNLYYPDSRYTNNCILLLTGKEQIRKTSHFRYLFPPFIREQYIAFTTHGFSNESQMRDITKISAGNVLVVWDEIEQYLDSQTESNFKKIIDNNPQQFIDKYEVSAKTVVPMAIYGGTSNQREFKLGSEGSRRIFHIPITWVDTDRLSKICWHKVVNQLKTEVDRALKKGDAPWLLSKFQLELQRELHAKIVAKNSMDMVLDEIWKFDDPPIKGKIPGVHSVQGDKSGRLLTTRDIVGVLESRGMININRAALRRSLERLCGNYTGSLRSKRVMNKPKCVIERGLAIQHQYKKWVLPPLRDTRRGKWVNFDNICL